MGRARAGRDFPVGFGFYFKLTERFSKDSKLENVI